MRPLPSHKSQLGHLTGGAGGASVSCSMLSSSDEAKRIRCREFCCIEGGPTEKARPKLTREDVRIIRKRKVVGSFVMLIWGVLLLCWLSVFAFVLTPPLFGLLRLHVFTRFSRDDERR